MNNFVIDTCKLQAFAQKELKCAKSPHLEDSIICICVTEYICIYQILIVPTILVLKSRLKSTSENIKWYSFHDVCVAFREGGGG